MAQKKMNTGGNRLSIGLLAADFTDKYEVDIMKGVLKKAEEADISVITFIGGSIHADHIDCSTNFFQAWKNTVFDLVSPDNVDGLVSITDVICTYANESQKKSFYDRFSGIPIVSAGTMLDGYASVTVDELIGIQNVVNHLVEIHRCKSIAFIGNMNEIPYYRKRFEAYKNTLYKKQIPFSSSLVERGGFSKKEIYASVEALLKQKTQFDALVCVDDFMASHAMSRLSEHGLFIPSDVIVTGFDDIAESRFFSPALTTVRQPLQQIGYDAAELLIQIITNGIDTVENRVLNSELVIRRSCGCFYNRVNEKKISENEAAMGQGIIESLVSLFKSQDTIGISDDVYTDWAGRLYEPFKSGLHKDSDTHFYKAITELSKCIVRSNFNILDFKRIVAPFISILSSHLKHDSDYFYFDKIRGNTMEIIDEIAAGFSIHRQLQHEHQSFSLYSISQRLISSCDDIAKLENVVKSDFSGIGIPGFSLSLYQNKSTKIVEQKIRLGIKSKILINNNHSFPAKRILPEGIKSIKKRVDLVILPLNFNNEPLGYAVFELGIMDGLLYETLANLLSSTIKEMQLIETVHKHASHLKEVVANRTKDILTVNEQLRVEIERKEKIENDLKNEKELAQITLSSIGDCVITTDAAYYIRYVNPVAELLLEKNAADIEGMHINDIFHIDSKLEEVIFKDPVEWQYSTPSGRHVDISLFAARIPGSPGGNIFVARDISKRKKAEHQAQEQLEQLIQAGKMASLGILISGVAHEINNPNNFIMLNAPVLKDILSSLLPELSKIEQISGDRLFGGIEWDILKKQLPGLVDGIINGAYRINTIVKELKNYAQPVTLEKEQNVNINDIVNSSIVLLSAIIEKSSDHFNLELDEQLPVICCNRQKIEQVIINLISNACQALSSSEQALYIRTCFNQDSQMVCVEVKDEGVGIKPGDIDHISDPFFTTKRQQGGLGLGLSLSARIVQEHQGSLHFHSIEGEGTHVTLLLPSQEDVKAEHNA